MVLLENKQFFIKISIFGVDKVPISVLYKILFRKFIFSCYKFTGFSDNRYHFIKLEEFQYLPTELFICVTCYTFLPPNLFQRCFLQGIPDRTLELNIFFTMKTKKRKLVDFYLYYIILIMLKLISNFLILTPVFSLYI